MATKPVELSNSRAWPTQSAALDYFRRMLARYVDGDVVNADDHADLLALLVRYDATITDGPTKIGVGVDVFMRRYNLDGGISTSGFWVRRVDGSETDFSYIQAVKGHKPGLDHEFSEACRMAVADDIRTAKHQFFDTYADECGRVACELSGRLITFEEAHVDHADPTFRQLVITFRAAHGWQENIPPGVLTVARDRQTHAQFADPNTLKAFREFHKVALLRVVAAGVNIAMAAGQRRPHVSRPVVLP